MSLRERLDQILSKWTDEPELKREMLGDMILHAIEEIIPEKLTIPKEITTDDKTLAEVSYDRGYNEVIDEMKEKLK